MVYMMTSSKYASCQIKTTPKMFYKLFFYIRLSIFGVVYNIARYEPALDISIPKSKINQMQCNNFIYSISV